MCRYKPKVIWNMKKQGKMAQSKEQNKFQESTIKKWRYMNYMKKNLKSSS